MARLDAAIRDHHIGGRRDHHMGGRRGGGVPGPRTQLNNTVNASDIHSLQKFMLEFALGGDSETLPQLAEGESVHLPGNTICTSNRVISSRRLGRPDRAPSARAVETP